MRHATTFLIFLIFAGCTSYARDYWNRPQGEMTVTEEDAIRNESLAGSYRSFGGSGAGGGPGFVSVGGGVGGMSMGR